MEYCILSIHIVSIFFHPFYMSEIEMTEINDKRESKAFTPLKI
jgi:hypothetical protein